MKEKVLRPVTDGQFVAYYVDKKREGDELYYPPEYFLTDAQRKCLPRQTVAVKDTVNNVGYEFYKAGKFTGKSILGKPGEGSTETFITIGNFKTEKEAANCQKYIQTKFVQCMLSILKVTQHNAPKTWECVPMQDFTDESDINWDAPLHAIDRQLYDKYKLDIHERLWVECHYKYGEIDSKMEAL